MIRRKGQYAKTLIFIELIEFFQPPKLMSVEGKCRRINGYLYSVNPYALRQNINIFWQNERTLTLLDTASAGQVLIMEIGVTCVGRITQTYAENQVVEKGDEKGYFAFGGSSTLILFEPDTITLSNDLIEQSAQGNELYARMGDEMGMVRSQKPEVRS